MTLAPAPFALVLPDKAGEAWLGLALAPPDPGADPGADPGTLAFAPGSAYAREQVSGAALYLTDPACAPGAPPGFNILGAAHRRADGSLPVTAILPDAASRDCTAPGRLPPGVSAWTRVPRLHGRLRAGGRDWHLVFDFVSG